MAVRGARATLTLSLLVAVWGPACGGSSPSAPAPGPVNPPAFTLAGTVKDRLTGELVSGSTIAFNGVSGTITDGAFTVFGVNSGNNRVTIAGGSHVPHEVASLLITQAEGLSFSVIRWGTSRFGATYDETFHQFFHQFARVSSGPAALRKWAAPPQELYLVRGTVPEAQFEVVARVLDEVNRELLPDLWCGLVGPLQIRQGPDLTSAGNGQIVVRPNWDQGANATLGGPRSGLVNVNVFGPSNGQLLSEERLAGILAHELTHVSGGFHVCGGDLGSNPFGFSRTRCPYPKSLMANLGDSPRVASPEDKLAACLIHHPDTHVGNLFPDTNPTYR